MREYHQQIQQRPTCTIYERGALTFSYASCMEEFSMTIGSLVEDTVYSIDIAESAAGPWFIHAYFALLTDEEKASKTKLLTFNNAYDGNYFFRARKVFIAGIGSVSIVIRKPARPLASEIPAPVISISNLTDITEVSPTNRFNSLAAYEHDGGIQTPVSAIELSRSMPHLYYVQPTKKYAAKWKDLNNFTDLDDNATSQQIVTVTSPVVGATIRWTRDNTDPIITSPIQTLNGALANAAVQRDDFSGVIRARCWSGDCRSPLAVVLVDKSFYERPYAVFHHSGTVVTGSCDLPRDGHESGQSCNVLYGGTAAFEVHIREASNVSGSADTVLISRLLKSVVIQEDYLGWENYKVGWSNARFNTTDWLRNDRYLGVKALYNWLALVTDLEATVLTVETNPVGGGSGSSPAINAQMDLLIDTIIPAYPNEHEIDCVSFDIVQSPYSLDNPRNDFWGEVMDSLLFAEPPPPEPGDPVDPAILLNVENWEDYEPGEMVTDTLAGGNGFALAWIVTTFIDQLGVDDFEDSALGEIEDSHTLEEGEELVEWGGGESWVGGWWVTSYPIPYETFESYSIGAMDQFNFDGGVGWSDSWFPWPNFNGEETWEVYNAYAEGTTYTSNFGGLFPDSWTAIPGSGSNISAVLSPGNMAVVRDAAIAASIYGCQRSMLTPLGEQFHAEVQYTIPIGNSVVEGIRLVIGASTVDGNVGGGLPTILTLSGRSTTSANFFILLTDGLGNTSYVGGAGEYAIIHYVTITHTYGVLDGHTSPTNLSFIGNWIASSFLYDEVQPDSLSGLQIWLDAQDSGTLFQDSALTTPASANTDPIGGWTDKSGNNFHALQVTGGSRPLLGTSGVLNRGTRIITFDGVDDFLSQAAAVAAFKNLGGLTIVAVMIAQPGAANGFVWVCTTSGALTRAGLLTNLTNGDIIANGRRLAADANQQIFAANTLSVWHQVITDHKYSAATLGIRVDGADAPAPTAWQTAGLCENADSTAVRIGAFADGTSPWKGSLAELIVYNRSLTTTERDNLNGYLRNKYGVY